jgi:hypothetical protein
MTAFGVIWRGVHYVGGCADAPRALPLLQRAGAASYSLAQELVAGLASYAARVARARRCSRKLVDDVPECAAAGGWRTTLGDALGMATGRYASAEREVDEDAR